MNLYVIDDATRRPISGAAVRVGSLDGTTDATGLFIAHDVHGPQTVTAKAGTYRSDVWVGANGANLTMNLEKADAATPASATLTGQITGFAAITVAAGHAKDAVVVYSQTSDLGDPANEIMQTGNGCFVRLAAQDCPFTVTARTGKIALIAAIFDRNLNGTPNNFDDDTQTLIGWASRRGVTVAGGANQTGVDLAPIAAGQLQTLTVDFGTPPLAFVGGLIGIELGDEGVFQLPTFLTAAGRTLLAPRLDVFGSTAYRLTGISSDANPATKQSIVLRKGLTGTTLAAGEWLASPSGTLTRSGGSWTKVTGATVHSLEYTQGTTKIVNLTVFDGTTSVTLPDLIAVPSGSLTVTLNAIGAPGLDVTDFSLDRDEDKLVQVGGSIVQL